MHGLGISRRTQQITSGLLLSSQARSFPALHRMEEEGWISSFWGESRTTARQILPIVKAGLKQLEIETTRGAAFLGLSIKLWKFRREVNNMPLLVKPAVSCEISFLSRRVEADLDQEVHAHLEC